MSAIDTVETLKVSKVFKGLSDDDLKMISEQGKVTTFEPNETIIREGQTGHPLFIVIKGRVEVVLPKEGSGQATTRATRIKLSRLAQGDCLGEYTLFRIPCLGKRQSRWSVQSHSHPGERPSL